MLRLLVSKDGKEFEKVSELTLHFMDQDIKGFVTIKITESELEMNSLNNIGPMLKAKGEQVDMSINEFISETG